MKPCPAIIQVMYGMHHVSCVVKNTTVFRKIVMQRSTTCMLAGSFVLTPNHLIVVSIGTSADPMCDS